MKSHAMQICLQQQMTYPWVISCRKNVIPIYSARGQGFFLDSLAVHYPPLWNHACVYIIGLWGSR